MRCQVKLRRGEGFEVKQSAECIDGRFFDLMDMGEIESSSVYPKGETEWSPTHRKEYPGCQPWPLDAPNWVASGDLVFCDPKYDWESIWEYQLKEEEKVAE